MLRESGSIEGFFAEGDDPNAGMWVRRWVAFCAVRSRGYARGLRAQGRRNGRVSATFFPNPLAGSACKRLNLFMRWIGAEGRD
jgi:hypothetical protein